MPDDRTSPVPMTRAFIVAILLAVGGAWLSSQVADRLRATENVEHGETYRGTRLSIESATRNAAVAYGLLGAVLSMGLGAIAGRFLGRHSIPRALLAGLAGAALGASLGAASSFVLTPAYFHRLESADITLTVLIHLGIWGAVGVAAGAAFALGWGDRGRFGEPILGGMMGAASAAMLFDIGGAFFPLAHTERPLAEEARTRLAAAVLLGVFSVVGIALMAYRRPAVTAKRT